MESLYKVAQDLVAPGKGILAADESTPSANKRLRAVGIPETPEMRRVYRELFTTAPGIEPYLGGVILYEETLVDSTRDGVPFPKLLRERGIHPGIKVDMGTEPFGDDGEVITHGLEGLAGRLKKYKELGATFAKWRAVIRIEGDKLPTDAFLKESATRLCKYAKTCQREGFVPIVEPEVLLEGDHTRARAAEVIEEALAILVAEVVEQHVDPRALLIKSSMALSGSDSGCHDTTEEVATDTLHAFHEAVPDSIAGIVFLSGGQSEAQATLNLQTIASKGPQPWPLTFSYARALQQEALHIWKGEDKNIPKAQEVFLKRLELVSKASRGEYDVSMEEDIHKLISS